MPVTTETIKSLSDDELDRLMKIATEEKEAREERHKQETIARIRELAGVIGVSVIIGGARGRPRSGKKPKEAKAKRAS
jgi:hypothetical protein